MDKNNQKIIFSLVGGIVISAILVFAVFQISPNFFGMCKTQDLKSEDKEEQASKEKPSFFEETESLGIKISYPDDWGEPDKDKTKEDFTFEDMPGKLYDGESITFDDNGFVYVMEKKSLDKDKDIKDTMSLLEDLYEKQGVDPEEVYALSSPYIPQPNAGVLFYNPRYTESQNGKWRGYWFLSNMSQDVSVSLNMIAVMYNKEAEKVVSANISVWTDKSDALDEKFFSGAEGYDGNSMMYDLQSYLKTAYLKDKDMKEIIDADLLNFCLFIE